MLGKIEERLKDELRELDDINAAEPMDLKWCGESPHNEYWGELLKKYLIMDKEKKIKQLADELDALRRKALAAGGQLDSKE